MPLDATLIDTDDAELDGLDDDDPNAIGGDVPFGEEDDDDRYDDGEDGLEDPCCDSDGSAQDAGSFLDSIENTIGSAASSVGGAIGSAASSVGGAIGGAASAIGGGVASIGSDIGGDFSQASNYLASLGEGIVAPAYHWADSEYQSFRAYAQKAIQAIGPVLPAIETGLSLFPGFGTAAAAALAATAAILQNQSLSSAVLAGFKAAVPGGPEMGMVVDLAQQIGQGKGWSALALQAGRDAVVEELGPAAGQIFDESTAIGYGIYKTQQQGGNVGQYLGGVASTLAGDAAKAIESGHPDLSGFIQQAQNIEKLQPGAMKSSMTTDPSLPPGMVHATTVIVPNGGPTTANGTPIVGRAMAGSGLHAVSFGPSGRTVQGPSAPRLATIAAPITFLGAEGRVLGPAAAAVRALGAAPIAQAAGLPTSGPAATAPPPRGLLGGLGALEAAGVGNGMRRGAHWVDTNGDGRVQNHETQFQTFSGNALRAVHALLTSSRLRARPLRSVALALGMPTAAVRAAAGGLLESSVTGEVPRPCPWIARTLDLDRSFDELIEADAGGVAIRTSPRRDAATYVPRSDEAGFVSGVVGDQSDRATQDRLLAWQLDGLPGWTGDGAPVSPAFDVGDVDGAFGPRSQAMLAAYNTSIGAQGSTDRSALASRYPQGSAATPDATAPAPAPAPASPQEAPKAAAQEGGGTAELPSATTQVGDYQAARDDGSAAAAPSNGGSIGKVLLAFGLAGGVVALLANKKRKRRR